MKTYGVLDAASLTRFGYHPAGARLYRVVNKTIIYPDGYGGYEGLFSDFGDVNLDIWEDGTVFNLDAQEVFISSNGLNLNDNGFSTNQNITIDHISALEKGRPLMGNSIEAIILPQLPHESFPSYRTNLSCGNKLSITIF